MGCHLIRTILGYRLAIFFISANSKFDIKGMGIFSFFFFGGGGCRWKAQKLGAVCLFVFIPAIEVFYGCFSPGSIWSWVISALCIGRSIEIVRYKIYNWVMVLDSCQNFVIFYLDLLKMLTIVPIIISILNVSEKLPVNHIH